MNTPMKVLLRASLALLIATAVVETGSAQTVDELRGRVTDLERLWQEADALAQEEERRSLPVLSTDTIHAGPLVLITEAVDFTPIREAAALAQEQLEKKLGENVDVLENVQLLLTQRPIGTVTIRPASRAWTRELPIRRLAVALVDEAYKVLDLEHNPAFREWLGVQTPTVWYDLDLRQAYTELVTAPFTSTSGCMLGNLVECRKALGLTPTDDYLTAWYTADDRRTLVLQRERPSDRLSPIQAARYDECVDNSDDESCATFLRAQARFQRTRPPLSATVRSSLVRHALEVGGSGSYRRLFYAKGSIADQLTAAAGMPADALLRSWRTMLFEVAGTPTSVTFPLWLSAILWLAVFSAMALRSTRWK